MAAITSKRKGPATSGATTVTLTRRTKVEVLDALKVHPRETYDEEFNRLLGPLVKKPQEAVAAGGA
ncbi:MAG: hypothetical protein KGI98_14480 [Euryarchaeota archaeon]|nr:hypothetical protein [Euryarchaeota archaeon]MDE1881151.1 hypothetical protein [Euryarchaeota archaeon]